jgi:multidrug resistance efflux pump
MILAPRLQGRVFQFTLTGLIPNGTRVKQGDIVAEFDRTAQVEEARTATAQVADLGHQIERRRAENHANAAKRSAEMREAQAAWEKARIQLRIAEVRSEIERDKNRVLSDAASKRVEMLREIHRLRDEADAAELRILELQRDRQQVALDRATRNAELLVMTSPMAGMVSIESVWKSGTQGPAQVGDRLYRGSPLMRIFNPARMEVTVELGEPDGAILKKGARAEVLLDAYPDLVFHGTLVTASPVASSALGSPIRRFTATFAIEESDPHLLPDLSAQVVIRPQPATGGAHE